MAAAGGRAGAAADTGTNPTAGSVGGEAGFVTHCGQCHCGAVEFEFDGSRDLLAWECDCSVCSMRRNTHVIVPATRFRLLRGADALTTYQFNTMTARHFFCSRCGISPFYRPRSNPSGFAVTVWCIASAPRTVRSVTVRQIAGSNWEEAVAASGIRALG